MAEQGSKKDDTPDTSSATAPNFKLCGLPSRECYESIDQHEPTTSLHTALLQKLSLPQNNIILEFHLSGESCDRRRPFADFNRWASGDLKEEVFYLHARRKHPAGVPLLSKADGAGKVSRTEIPRRLTRVRYALTRELGPGQLQTVWFHRPDCDYHVDAKRTG